MAVGVAGVAEEEPARDEVGTGDGKTIVEEVCDGEVAEGCGEGGAEELPGAEVGGSDPVVSDGVGAGEGAAGGLLTAAYESVICWDSMGSQTRIVNR